MLGHSSIGVSARTDVPSFVSSGGRWARATPAMRHAVRVREDGLLGPQPPTALGYSKSGFAPEGLNLRISESNESWLAGSLGHMGKLDIAVGGVGVSLSV